MHLKPKIVWIDGIGCNGCSHSFFNYEEFDNFLDDFELLYHPLLYFDNFEKKSDILIIEGALREGFKRNNKNLIKLIEELIINSKFVICLGTCSSYGGIFGEGVMFNKKENGIFYDYKNKIINIPGCPPHPNWLGYVLYMIKEQQEILLDELNRPKEIFAFTTHAGCSRNEYFEWKIDSENFGEKEGCLFYYQGCQGPFTHSSCNRDLWNGVNSKTRAGTPCFGCTESCFPKNELFKTQTLMGIPANIPLGVSKRAYLTLSGIAKSLKNERLSQKLFEYKDKK